MSNPDSANLRRTWSEAEIEAIAASDSEFPPISDEDLARALADAARRRAAGARHEDEGALKRRRGVA